MKRTPEEAMDRLTDIALKSADHWYQKTTSGPVVDGHNAYIMLRGNGPMGTLGLRGRRNRFNTEETEALRSIFEDLGAPPMPEAGWRFARTEYRGELVGVAFEALKPLFEDCSDAILNTRDLIAEALVKRPELVGLGLGNWFSNESLLRTKDCRWVTLDFQVNNREA